MLKRLSLLSVLLTAIFWISACTESDKKNESPAAGDKVEMAVAPEAPTDVAATDMPAPPADPAAPHAGCPHHNKDAAATGGCGHHPAGGAGGCEGCKDGGCTMCEGCKDGAAAGGCANCPGCKDGGCANCEGCKGAGGCANCPGCAGKTAPATK